MHFIIQEVKNIFKRFTSKIKYVENNSDVFPNVIKPYCPPKSEELHIFSKSHLHQLLTFLLIFFTCKNDPKEKISLQKTYFSKEFLIAPLVLLKLKVLWKIWL